MITDERIAELKRLADAATAGPWGHDPGGYGRVCDGNCGEPFEYSDGSATGLIERHGSCRSIAGDIDAVDDAAFIAAARTAVPALLDEIERLRAELVMERQVLRLRFRDLQSAHDKLAEVLR